MNDPKPTTADQRAADSQPTPPTKRSRPRRRAMIEIDAKNAQYLWQIMDWRRRDLGLSINGLARHTKISPIRLSRYLRGMNELGSNHVDVLLYSLGLRLTIEPGFTFHKRPAPVRLPRIVVAEPMNQVDAGTTQQEGNDHPSHQ